MPRNVALGYSQRCERCHYSPRWCICAAERPLVCPVAVDVLIDSREYYRPTSTGRLITRLIPDAREHLYRHDLPLIETEVRRPDRELWILHPLGEPLAMGPETIAAGAPQVLLLDGSWREAAKMLHRVERWGRRVSLPMSGPSRYLLRSQQDNATYYSTAEALLFLLDALGLKAEHAALRLQFELHVYAGLRARGEKALAEKFLEESPIREAFPEVLAELNRARPRE